MTHTHRAAIALAGLALLALIGGGYTEALAVVGAESLVVALGALATGGTYTDALTAIRHRLTG